MTGIKVLILGGTGMLGGMLTRVLSEAPGFEVTATARTAPLKAGARACVPLHAASGEQLEDAVSRVGPAWIINAIGIVKQKLPDTAAGAREAIETNSLFPHLLSAVAGKHGAQVIQIATDCVFSGLAGRYTEASPHDALDVYGKTKSLGEVKADHFYNLRCSIIGPEAAAGRSLYEWFRRQPPGAVVPGFSNHLWNGITTLHFAKLCAGVIRNRLPLPRLQHVLPEGDISKEQLLRLIMRGLGRGDLTITPTEAPQAVNRTLRTLSPALNNDLWKAAGYAAPPGFEQMIEELTAFPYGTA